ncbi:MAG TPA: ShlB/FhaC/HecB family hemolysin secretion/activation protein, partial [Alphaproteobacteria bacterium]|nr:ShlB/FhaC/HecB family hemolysin secretion/activation protein [Alphaproteobacteria bacterium]
MSVRGTLNYKNSSTDLRDTLLSEDRIRAARIGVSGDMVDKLRGISLLDLELSQGLDILNAS